MNDLAPALAVLNEEDRNVVLALANELSDTWTKRQVFRTETEMRFSVLDDGHHPTKAAKYWQSVREQAGMLDSLVSLSFDMRRNTITMQRLAAKLADAHDPLDHAELSVDMDEAMWKQASMEQVAKDRVREIGLWSAIKAECDDGSFDTTNVNTHQADSYRLTLTNRLNTLTAGSSQSEVLNVIGPLNTLNRLQQEGVLLTAPAPAPRLQVAK